MRHCSREKSEQIDQGKYRTAYIWWSVALIVWSVDSSRHWTESRQAPRSAASMQLFLPKLLRSFDAHWSSTFYRCFWHFIFFTKEQREKEFLKRKIETSKMVSHSDAPTFFRMFFLQNAICHFFVTFFCHKSSKIKKCRLKVDLAWFEGEKWPDGGMSLTVYGSRAEFSPVSRSPVCRKTAIWRNNLPPDQSSDVYALFLKNNHGRCEFTGEENRMCPRRCSALDLEMWPFNVLTHL